MPARDIAHHVPYLRRYARALTGSQPRGDAVVQAMFEGLLTDRLVLAVDLPVKVALFTAFHAHWRRELNGHSIDSEAQSGAERRLQSLSPEFRAALLLVLMEGFTEAEAATILNLPIETTRERLYEAESQIQGQMATDVLIIEDEPIVALDLERLVRELGHHVTGVAATRAEASAITAAQRPGLVLADVQLADGSSGLDAVNDILRHSDIPVIFITAFPGSLLTGGKAEPAFLVVKPFREEELRAVIGQALFFHTPTGAQPQRN
jgi:DNA-directed RNA polymerase specialized sigma24 family protein